MPETATLLRPGDACENSPTHVVPNEVPTKVLITGGREVGGLNSFAEALSEGFRQLGILTEIISPRRTCTRWGEMRDRRVLKILSTTALFAAPFVRSAICVTHGFPTAGIIGWKKFFGHLIADHIANHCSGVCLTTVSHYSAVHLRAVLGTRIDEVIANPLRELFLEPPQTSACDRLLITYAGRLHPSKNLPLLLQPIMDILEEFPGMRACIIGDGPQRTTLERIAGGHPRVEFTGSLAPLEVRKQLRHTKVLISGCPTEALGISYVEALSQGCNLVMPACGGGLEIAPELIGSQIQLMPVSLERSSVSAAIRRALSVTGSTINADLYSPRAVASAYLAVWLRRRDSKMRKLPFGWRDGLFEC